ncbi:hypothetical protein [Erwinia rhapontici]|uniref:hypothetical protein n=1 Tax=Erwinia rhapontici TaxID=55212 RepID=UPI00105E5682|nr:hypothetical protein [Erwinia rhapontici]TDS93427.1 hypothetical protein EDF84_11179 [Erwinia rhapontici]
MSTINTFPNNSFFKSRRSLSDVLQQNQGTYTVSKDGFVSLDLSNDDVRNAIVLEIKKLNNIKEVKR